jgi:hypothetical protein
MIHMDCHWPITNRSISIGWGASVLNTISTLSVIIVAREYFINKALHAHTLLPLFGQVHTGLSFLPSIVDFGSYNEMLSRFSRMWCIVCSGYIIGRTRYQVNYNWDHRVKQLHLVPPSIFGCHLYQVH